MPANTKVPGLSTSVKALQPAAEWSRRVAEQLNMVSPIVGGDGIEIAQVPGVGTTVSVQKPLTRGRDILAVIQSTGPGGAADYTDNRYWFKRAYLHQTTLMDMSSLAKPEVDPQDNNATAQTFTNLAEAAASTHSLTAGSFLWVTPVEGRIDSTATINQFTQYVTCMGSAATSSGFTPTYTRTTINSNATTSGTYVPCGTMTLTNGLYQVTGNVVATKVTTSATIEIGAGFSTSTSSFDDGYSGNTKFTGSDLFDNTNVVAALPTRIIDNRTGGTMTLYPVIIGSWTAFSGGSMTYAGSYTVLKLG